MLQRKREDISIPMSNSQKEKDIKEVSTYSMRILSDLQTMDVTKEWKYKS